MTRTLGRREPAAILPGDDPAARGAAAAGRPGARSGVERPHVHLPEPTYPCYLPVLGEFSRMTPHVGPTSILALADSAWPTSTRAAPAGRLTRRSEVSMCVPPPMSARMKSAFAASPRAPEGAAGQDAADSGQEDSPSGLWRTLGTRVGLTPSRVRIPHPPPIEARSSHGAPGLFVAPDRLRALPRRIEWRLPAASAAATRRVVGEMPLGAATRRRGPGRDPRTRRAGEPPAAAQVRSLRSASPLRTPARAPPPD